MNRLPEQWKRGGNLFDSIQFDDTEPCTKTEILPYKIEHAIKGRPIHSLSGILQKRPVEFLRDAAVSMGMDPTMNKKLLVKALSEELPSRNVFIPTMLNMPYTSLQFFQELQFLEHIKSDTVRMATYLPLQQAVLLQSFYWDESMIFLVPKEIKRFCRQYLFDGTLGRILDAVLMHEYMKAAVTLYGIIKPRELAAICNSQNDTSFSEKDFIAVLEMYQDEQSCDYLLTGDYLVSNIFYLLGMEKVQVLEKEIRNKARYIPKKEEMFDYAHDGWDEEYTQECSNLEQFLRSELGMRLREARKMTLLMSFYATNEVPLQDQMDTFFYVAGIPVREVHTEMKELLTDINDNTRIWSEKGHTRREARQLADAPRIKMVKGGRNKK